MVNSVELDSEARTLSEERVQRKLAYYAEPKKGHAKHNPFRGASAEEACLLCRAEKGSC